MPVFDSIVYNIIVFLVPENLIHYVDSQGFGKCKIINDITAKKFPSWQKSPRNDKWSALYEEIHQ